MVNLKDIVHKARSGSRKRLADTSGAESNASTQLATNISSKFSLVGSELLGINSDKQAEFAEQTALLVTNDKFLDELQDVIGKPQPNESEDDFVIAAKDKMRQLLKSKLK